MGAHELLELTTLLKKERTIFTYEYESIRNDVLEDGLEKSKVDAMEKIAGFSK